MQTELCNIGGTWKTITLLDYLGLRRALLDQSDSTARRALALPETKSNSISIPSFPYKCVFPHLRVPPLE